MVSRTLGITRMIGLGAAGLALALTGCLEGDGAPGSSPDPKPDTSVSADTSTGAPDTVAGAPDTSTGAPDLPATDPDTLVDPGPGPGPSDPAFVEAYSEVLAASQSMTVEQFFAEHTPAAMPEPLKLSYEPTASTYFEAIDDALALTDAEKARIADNGFMVSERLTYPSFGEALLYGVYETDLPVLVTTDMILHALHSSYDDILKMLEREILLTTIDDVLAKAAGAIGAMDVGGEPDALAAIEDADFFVATARSLLAAKQVPAQLGADVDTEVAKFLEYVAAEQMRSVEIFGTARKMDFSQFKPRGHYEGDQDLERYFRALMWLGRIDFRPLEQDPMTFQWVFSMRQLVASWILQQAVTTSGGMTGWDQANDLITLMVGPVDYIDFRGIQKMNETHGFTSASGVAAMSQETRDALLEELLGGVYGEQQINSHWLETDPMSSEPTPLPPSIAFLGQRFIVDSHVFANVVYDNIVFDGVKVQRVLPDPLDALFVLGNDQVLPLLEPELDKFPYQGNLNALRFLVDYYEPEFWESNMYNLWLGAIRTLNAPTTGDEFLEAMRTPAWRDRVVNTQLGSWAQLRHDTLLYAKQSYTGGVSCAHPDGFVEPYPAFYAALGTLAAVASETLVNVPFPNAWTKDWLSEFFANWSEKMAILGALATKELAGEPFDAEEIAFLKETIQGGMGCGEPVYSGWYPKLFLYGGDKAGEYKPTIADVHTNPNTGPLPGPDVLHVATGRVNLMVLTAETCEGPEAYVGPVFSYYEIDLPEIRRLADSDWEAMLAVPAEIPARPEWTASFLVSE